MELTLVANFLRPFAWLSRLRRFSPRVGITRTPRGWTPGVVLRHAFAWGSPPSRRSSQVEYPTRVGPFRQRSQFFRRQFILFRSGRRRPSRAGKIKVRSPYLGFQTKLSPTPPRGGVGELPPRNFNSHWNFWSGPRKGPTRRGVFPSYRGFFLAATSVFTRQRKRYRLRRLFEGVPHLRSFFRKNYLTGINTLLSRFQIQNLTPFNQPLRTVTNRFNLTCSRNKPSNWSYYLTLPSFSQFGISSAGRPLLSFRRRKDKRGRPAGFFSRRRRRRLARSKLKLFFSRPTIPVLPLRNEGIKQLLESTASFLAVKYHYRRGRDNIFIRLRRRNQLATRLSRRGWYFRRPCPRGREQPFFLSEEAWVPSRRENQRRINKRNKKALGYRKRQRTNRIRRQRRKRMKWVPRRIWRLFRRFAHYQPNRRFRHRGGVLGLSRRATFSFTRRLLSWLGPHWWRRPKQKKLRPRVMTPRRNRICLARRRRGRLIKRASWRGTRVLTRVGRSVRGYLRQRRFQLGTPKRRLYRGKPRRGRIAQTVSKVNFSPFSISLENHLTRWRGLFTKAGHPSGGEQLVRQISRLSPQDQILRLYRLFYTPLGARTRRKGGALVKVPSLLRSSQAWNLVRRWFTRGVETRGDRTWSARAIYEVMDPARTGRAREEFLRAALLNSALL